MRNLGRREVLKGALALGAVWPHLFGRAAASDARQAFRAALAEKPWLLGWLGTSEELLAADDLPVEGRLPGDLQGVFYRNGPAQHEVGALRYRHWFDGDGMVQAFRIGDGKVSHRGRMISTAKYASERAAGEALQQAFGTELPHRPPPGAADDINVANINIVKHAGELLALWEGGSAYRVEEGSLETLGVKTWSPETKGVPFGAHPRLDRDGTLWNIGYAPVSDALLVFDIAPSGRLRRVKAFPMKRMPMIHDFAVTDRSLLVPLPPLRFDRTRGGSFLDRFVWEGEEPLRLLVLDKNTLEPVRTVELPTCWLFHISNAWESADRRIHFDFPRYRDSSIVSETMRDIMTGEFTHFGRLDYARCVVDVPAGAARMERLDGVESAEFPRIDPRASAARHRHAVLAASRGNEFGTLFGRILRVDFETGKMDAFAYDEAETAEEHVVVPGARDGEAWILGTTLDFVRRRTVLNVFDFHALSNGPVARVPLPYPLPFGLHGNFIPA